MRCTYGGAIARWTVVAVRADVGIDVEVVQQDEIARQLVMVRRDVLPKQRQGSGSPLPMPRSPSTWS